MRQVVLAPNNVIDFTESKSIKIPRHWETVPYKPQFKFTGTYT